MSIDKFFWQGFRTPQKTFGFLISIWLGHIVDVIQTKRDLTQSD